MSQSSPQDPALTPANAEGRTVLRRRRRSTRHTWQESAGVVPLQSEVEAQAVPAPVAVDEDHKRLFLVIRQIVLLGLPVHMILAPTFFFFELYALSALNVVSALV